MSGIFFKRRFSRFSHGVKVHSVSNKNHVIKTIYWGGKCMTKNELLLELSKMMDRKLDPLKKDVSGLKENYDGLRKEVRDIKLLQENDILPRLQNIESCYTSTYKRYADGIQQLEAMQVDMDVMKIVVTEHSEKIQNLQKIQTA